MNVTADARIEYDAEDICAIRRALGVRRCDVLCDSWGGGIAMLGVLGDSGGTQRLVTVDSVGPTSAWMPEFHEIALSRLSPAGRETAAQLYPRLRTTDVEAQGAYSRATYPAWFVDAELAARFAPPARASATGSAGLGHLLLAAYY